MKYIKIKKNDECCKVKKNPEKSGIFFMEFYYKNKNCKNLNNIVK
ncbi:hypothetical protein HMPREF9220_0487 [Dialister micraerophilus UPII 345-E]|uniref:Uncharacterized protein n=1 Tax=Dialister micraerophilus UPII 345-E TaxID=910314 RepID=E4L9Q6_9FIRM|nr:hypothetical protein HMPREF9220_0487 [Dialister micraerophilus UPII 345-E]